MRTLFDLILDICLLRKGPQDLPASQVLLGLCLAAYGLSSLLGLLVSMQPSTAVFQTLADIVLLTGFAYGILALMNYQARFVQTLTALAGTYTLLNLIALPLIFWLERATTGAAAPMLPSLLLLVLMGWSIAVMAHVLQHALSTSRGMGVLYALGYLVISLVFLVLTSALSSPG